MALSLAEKRFADYIASGISQSDAYRRCWPESKASNSSIHAMACKLAARDDVKARVNELLKPSDRILVQRDSRLLDVDWVRHEIAHTLYEVMSGESGASGRERVDAAKALGQLKGMELFPVAQQRTGTTVNVQANQMAAPASPDLRSSLVHEIQHLLGPSTPLPVVSDEDLD